MISSHFETRETSIFWLPPELWEYILEIVIATPFIFDVNCTVDTFLSYCTQAIYNERPRSALPTLLWHVAQVCTTWRSFARKRVFLWLTDYNMELFARTMDQPFYVRRLDYNSRLIGRPNIILLDELLKRVNFHRTLVKLEVRTFSANYIQGPSEEEQRDNWDCLESMLTHGPHLKQLRALSLLINFTPFPNLLARLQTTFPQLTSLSLTGNEYKGEFSLPHLEYLHLDIHGPSDVGKWYFPSLNHLFLTRVPALYGGYLDLLYRHSRRLVSLEIWSGRGTIAFPEDFWEQLSNLIVLGVELSRVSFSTDPPPTHPLRRLSILSRVPQRSVTWSMTNADKFTSLTHLTLDTHPPLKSPVRKKDPWAEVIRECQLRSITCTNNVGEILCVREV